MPEHNTTGGPHLDKNVRNVPFIKSLLNRTARNERGAVKPNDSTSNAILLLERSLSCHR